MNKYATATILSSTLLIASAFSMFGPASFALMAGGNKISALSKSPNAAADWLSDNACRTIRTTITDEAVMWFTLAGLFLSLANPGIVFGVDYAYRRCVKRWPQYGGKPYDGHANGFFKKCYHKLLPDREAFIIFGTFLLSTTTLTISMVEIVISSMNASLKKGFSPAYKCYDPGESLEAPPFVNQIIKGMAEPVAEAARLAAYFPTVFFLIGSSFAVLVCAAGIGFWRNSVMEGERQPLPVNREEVRCYQANI